MSEPTRGPWVADITRDRYRVVTTSGLVVCTVESLDDARWIAEARAALPNARDDLARARADLHDVRVAAELAANHHRVELAELEAGLESMERARDDAAGRAARAEATARAAAARIAEADAEIARLRPLPDAIARFLRHRYDPAFLASWSAYLASCKE